MQFNEYVFILLWIGVVAVFAKYSPALKRKELVLGVEEERFNWIVILLLLLPLVFFAANRADYGDTYNYRYGFSELMPEQFSELSAYMNTINKDSAFYFCSSIIKILITKDYHIYFGILAAIQLISVFSIYRKYSNNAVFSAFLFVASADYFSWTHNGVRQFLAVTIIFAATALFINKKFFPLVLIILFASLFHRSALLMIPVMFFVQGKAWNKRNMALLIVAMIIILFVDNFTDVLDKMLVDTQYKSVVTDYKEWNDDGTNPFRVAVYSVPAIIAFLKREKIKEKQNKLINICVNMSIVTSALYLVSMVTSGIFLGRLPIYVSLYNYILLPWEIENLFEEETKRTIIIVAVILYLFYYYFQMHVAWSVL